jgi:hypothetical protein
MVPALPLLYPLPYLFANVSPLPATFTNYPGKNGSLPYLAEAYFASQVLLAFHRAVVRRERET